MCAPYFVNLNNASVKNAIILCSFTFTAKENRKTHLQLFVWGIRSSRETCRVQRCVWGWFSWLCARSPTASTFSAVRVVRAPPMAPGRGQQKRPVATTGVDITAAMPGLHMRTLRCGLCNHDQRWTAAFDRTLLTNEYLRVWRWIRLLMFYSKFKFSTVVKFTTSPDLCAHRTWKN